jgi:hypothetical protein
VPFGQSCRARTGAYRHRPADHTRSAGRSPGGHAHTTGRGPSPGAHGRAGCGSCGVLVMLPTVCGPWPTSAERGKPSRIRCGASESHRPARHPYPRNPDREPPQAAHQIEDSRVKPAKRTITTCTAVAAALLLGGSPAHAEGEGGLLGTSLLDSPSITLACFPAGQVGQGNSFTGTQNINCNQSASATGTTPPPSGNGLTGHERVSASQTVEPGATAEPFAVCPEGKAVTGGGFSTGEVGNSWELRSSQANQRPRGLEDPLETGWVAVATNTGTGPQTLTAHAVCYDAGPGGGQ